MLKHMSSRSESRNSYMSDDLMVTLTALNFSKDGDSMHDRSTDNLTGEVTTENYRASVDRSSSFSSLLPSSTLRRIIERRKSDLMLNDRREKRIAGSIHESANAREILQEIEKDNSKLVVHRRKLEKTEDSLDNEIDIDRGYDETMFIEKTHPKETLRKDSIPSPPLAISSPTSSPVKQKYTEDTLAKRKYPEDTVKSSRNEINYVSNGIKKYPSKQSLNFENLKYDHKNETNIYKNKHHHPTRTQSLSRVGYNRDVFHKHRHPLSVSTDMLNTSSYSNYSSSKRPSSVKSAGYYIPNRYASKETLSLHSQRRCRSKEKLDTLSVSAGSSVSNVKPSSVAMSRCSCGTMPRHNLLEKITEEMEIEHKNFNKNYDKKKNAIRYVKYFTIFLIVFAFICCTIAGFLHFYVRYISSELMLNQGDVKILKLSSLFCGGIEAISEESGVRVITFEDSENRKTLDYTRSESIYLKPDVIWKRKFYILKDSFIKIETETGESIEALAFIGERNFSIWEQRHESETYLTKMKCCRDRSNQKNNLSITTDRDERYYFAIKSLELLPINVNIKIKFLRKTLDFSKSVSSCSVKQQQQCTADYEFDTKNKIAIEVPLTKTSKISQSSRIEWKCQPRIWFYFVLFLGVFYLILIFLLAMYFLITRYLIPRDKCICLRESKKSSTNESVQFYDNYGKTNSDIGVTESSYKHSVTSQMKPVYGDDMSQFSDTSRFLGNLFETPSSVGTNGSILRTSAKQHPQLTVINHDFPGHAIAAIYNDNIEEQADSGISVDPETAPSYRHLDAHELMYQQELQFQRLKYLRQQKHKAEFVDAPSVKNLLRRPASRHDSVTDDFDKSLNSTQNYLHLSMNRNPNYYRSHSALPEKGKPEHHVSFDSIDVTPDDINKGEVYL